MIETENVMIVEVKYSYGSYTLKSTRFTYLDFDGNLKSDRKRFAKNGEAVRDRVIKYLTEERDMDVIGYDGSGLGVDYVVVKAKDHSFVSVNGEFEVELEA